MVRLSQLSRVCCVTKRWKQGTIIWTQFINILCVHDIYAWPCMHACSEFVCVPNWSLACLNVDVGECVHVCGSGVSQKSAVTPATWAIKPAIYPLLFPSLDLIYTRLCVALPLLHSHKLAVPFLALHQVQGPNPSLCGPLCGTELL